MSFKNLDSFTRLIRAVRPEIEKLEVRQLLSGDPLAYQNVIQSLPYSLNFQSAQNGVFDTNGLGTGFTLVQPNKNGNQYQPSLVYLSTAIGELNLTTTGTATAGSSNGTDNTQVNALETKFPATSAGFTITTRLQGPLSNLTANYENGGIFFGPDQDNYIKLVAGYNSSGGGQSLQFTDEQATKNTVNVYKTIGSFSTIQTLDLRLTGNAGTGVVAASYAINGGAFQTIAGNVTLSGTEQAAFFNSAGLAGIMASAKNNAAPVTVGFTHFEIDAGQAISGHPSIRYVTPANAATGISVSASIEADLNLPNSAINAQTVSNSTVYLYRNSDQSLVPAVVNTSGGGDSLILTPTATLAPNTQYTFVVTTGVTDTSGATMVPYQMSFTTGAAVSQVSPNINFTKTNLATATGANFTDVKIGPDGKLYASTEDGRIFRWAVNGDGTLATPQIITSIQTFNGGKRLITGFAFDPASTASNVVLWVSNSFYALSGATNGVDFTGKITVLSGPNLAIVQDAVVSLPRSVADHSTEQPVFGPGPIAGHNYLYFAQASNTAYGAPDTTWGNRSEHLLTAAILRLDTSAINLAAGPLNVLTPDAGGTYNPFAVNAPLIIYATGVRNAFSLVFTANGDLLAVNNGSSAGGNTPAYTAGAAGQINGNRIDTSSPYSGVNVPGLTNVQQTEDDYLYNITQGDYYGHPNPTRGEYVLDGGNPSTGGVTNEIFSAYPLGTNPDANYAGAAWDFGPHISPDGIIEYQDKTFGGAMQGALIVTEYSAGSDLVTLQRDSAGNIIGETKGIAGFTNLNNPVSLAENNANGNIYVSELGGQRIVLLTPVTSVGKATANKTVQPFNGVAPGYSGAGVSGAQSITITNTGTAPLTFPATGALQIINDPTAPTADAARFAITNASSLPASLAPGASFAIKVTYTAGKTGLQYARLSISSSDPSGPLTVALRGIGTTGTFGVAEPSLGQILRSYNIPTIIGAGPNDVNLNTQKYPLTPDASSQEVAMQRLVAADTTQPVTITPIASFSTATAAVSRIGYYTPGDPTSLDELFYIGKADAQTVNPTALGATSFFPGTATFALYGSFPGTTTPSGAMDTHYSEDALNTLDPTHARKIRFFPVENPDGSIVPNSYIVAMEDYNDPTTYNGFVNFVGIISNVKPALNAAGGSTPSSPAANNPPVMGVQENGLVPGSTNLVFNTIRTPNSIVPDVVHDTNTVTINNTGDQPLIITSLTLSDAKNWALVNPPAAGTAVAPGASLTLTIKFIATTDPSHTNNQTNDVASATLVSVQAAGGVWTGTLTINSNDPVTPSKTVNMAGYWQIQSEHENEPGLATLTNLLYGYSTNTTGSAATQGTELPNSGNTVVTYGSEVDPQTSQGLLIAADPTQPVSLMELAAFHQQYVTVDAVVGLVGEGVALESEDGNTVTITTAAANKFKVGDVVTINGDLNGYNGTYTITSLPTDNSFTYTSNLSDLDTSATAATQPQSGYYLPGGHTKFLFEDQKNNGQSVLPQLAPDSFSTVQTTFIPTGPFGLNLDGQKSQDSANPENLPFNTSGHGLRFFPVIDAKGNAVPNTYLVALDYRAYATPNGDYQDLFEIVSNVTFVALPATPIDLHATAGTAGVNLQWTPVSNATGYNVYRSTSATGTFTLVNNSPISSANYSDTTAPVGAVSYYKVTAVNSGGAESTPATAFSASVPAAPASVTPTPLTPASIKLTWTAAAGSTLYRIEREVVGSGTFVEVGTTTGLSFTDSGLVGGTSYAYQIRAQNGVGLSPYSTIVSASTATGTVPGAPSGLAGSVNPSGNVALSWTAASGTVTAYHIEREASGGAAFVEIAGSVSTTSFVDTTITAGVTYLYRVRAENGGAFGGYTANVTVSTGIGVPSNLSAVAVSATEIDLSWAAAAGNITRYHVERQDPITLAWSELGTSTALAYQDTSAQPGVIYNYRVRSESSGNYSAYTATVNAATPTSAPAAPATVNATVNASQVTLSWSAVSGAASYVIQRQITGSTTWTTLYAAYASGTSLIDTGVTPNVSYTYQVAAQNIAGTSAFVQSSAVSAVEGSYTSADIASTPAGSTTVNADGSSYDVSAYGVDIGSTATDGFRFVYKQVTGNFDAVVQVQSLTNTFSTAKAGLMVRSTLDAGSAMIFNGATAASNFRWLYRNALNATAAFASVGSNSVFPNVWLRLKRVGNVFTGYYSSDGLNWTQDGTLTLALPTTVYFGMAVTSHNTLAATTGQFRNLSVLLPPAVPVATAIASSTSSITVSWNSVASASSYSVLRLNTTTNTYATIATGLTGNSFLNTGLSASATYSYEVVATNSVGSSLASAPAIAATASNPSAPNVPSSLTGTSPSTGEIDLSWSAASGATSYTVQRAGGAGGSGWVIVGNNIATTTFHDTTVTAGTAYQYEVVSNNASGSSSPSSAYAISSQTAAKTLTSLDIGAPLAGSTTTVTNDSAYNVTAGGAGIYNNADSYRFVYTQVTGNFDIAVQVTSLSAVAGAYAQAGLMARATLDAGSPDVAITASTSGGYRFKYRGAANAVTTQTQTPTSISAAFPNAWVRIKRVGNLFTTYYSTNGTTWTTLGSVTMTAISSTTPIYVGMAVASGSTGATTVAGFQNLTGM